ncbi:hypothetical protein BGAL_0208g00060 [Botrytis galanthina]|uniref:Uncharacterized protein n=1 Tax=Botrytis galanthina TaxID=278940 RepID=A0A4S8QZN9_9HELO|nr:hypothetical protein BGAL_0208g00060 [Botrytis galanthina]
MMWCNGTVKKTWTVFKDELLYPPGLPSKYDQKKVLFKYLARVTIPSPTNPHAKAIENGMDREEV